MLYSFILETIIFLALGAIVFILARALPRIEDEVAVRKPRKERLARLAKKIPLDKIDDSLNLIMHKALRKTKIIILKADNFVTDKLKNVKGDSNKKNGTGIPV
ncbi:MAG: hypothetical protein WC565_00930 [Parcubacteria group bacterium]